MSTGRERGRGAGAPPGPLAVSLLNFNGATETARCLDSLLPQLAPEDRVWLVDNASRPEDRAALEADLARRNDARIRYAALPENTGFAGGHVHNFRRSREPVVVLLNNDTVLDPGWRDALVAPLAAPGVACAFAVVHDEGKGHEGLAPRRNGLNVFGQTWTEWGPEADAGEAFAVTNGACFAVRRDVVEAVGGLFPTEFFIYFEEVDLSWRLRAAGWRIVLARGARLRHVGEMTLRRDPASPLALKLLRSRVRNKYLAFRRNATWGERLALGPWLVGLDVARMLGLAVRGKRRIARARAQGILEAWRTGARFGSTGARARGYLTVDFRRHRL